MRAEKRRSQDLMSGRITASPSTSCMVTSEPIVYPVMEDQFLSLPRDATACLRARGCRAAYRHDRQTLRPVVPCMGRTQIVLFGVTPGSHMTDQVAALRRHCALSFDAPISLSVMPGGGGADILRKHPAPGLLMSERKGTGALPGGPPPGGAGRDRVSIARIPRW